MAELTARGLDRFLKGSDLIAALASVDGQGCPYIVPVWYEWDGTYLWVISKPRANYIRHLQRDSRLAVCIATRKLPYVRVLMQGRGRLIDTEKDWLPMGRRMAKRYLGKTKGYAYIDKTKNWKRVYLRIKPTRIISWDGGASGHAWGKKYVQRDT